MTGCLAGVGVGTRAQISICGTSYLRYFLFAVQPGGVGFDDAVGEGAGDQEIVAVATLGANDVFCVEVMALGGTATVGAANVQDG